jgi:hypothetical protein
VGTLAGLLVALFVTFLVVVLVGTALTVGTMAFGWRRVRRTLRVAPDTRSLAPTSWLMGMNERARLHRRLRAATATARSAAALGGEHLGPVVADIERQAVALERALVALPGRGWAIRPARAALAGEVTKLEGIARQLTTIAASRPSSPAVAPRTPLETLQERVDALNQAHAELNALDRLGHTDVADIAPPGRARQGRPPAAGTWRV